MSQLNLFSSSADQPINLLPYEGCVLYYGPVMPANEADRFYELLMQTVDWKNDEAIIFGKKIMTKRKAAWYGDHSFSYTYSKVTKTALPWNDPLLELKAMVEKILGLTFNSCLLNLYHDGQEGMAWHSDDERELQKNGTIASLSFGAVRKFAFKHKQTKETVALDLAHGSLLVMKDTTQTYWLHRLPPTTKVSAPRINLTFRIMNHNG